jgi:CDP-diacylglycerol--glycerol-3-phosphate 3-phosphatidyltransferase
MSSLKNELFGSRPPESVFSVPNVITLLRFVLSMVFFILAIQKMDITYNYIGLAIHWLGDMADGNYARFFKQETIVGAEMDLIADRVEILFFFIIFLVFYPQLYLPVTVYIFNFAFLDFYLCYQFVKFDIISINYFYKVDRVVYQYNFSFWAKILNSTMIIFLLILLPELWVLTTVLALGWVGIKSYSIYRVVKLR